MLWPVFLIALTGCAAPKITRRPRHPSPDPEHIIRQILSLSQNTRDLSGFSKFHIRSRGKNKSGRIAVNLKKNNFLLLGFLNILGQPVHYFMADEERIISFNPGKKSAVMGKPVAKNVNRLIGIKINVRDLVYFLLGGPADLDRFSQKPATYDPDTDRYRLVMEGEDETGELWVDPDTYRPVQYKSYDKYEKTILLVKWDDFQLIENIHFAREVFIELPREKTVIEVRYTDFDLNSGSGKFSLDIPPGTRIVLLDG